MMGFESGKYESELKKRGLLASESHRTGHGNWKENSGRSGIISPARGLYVTARAGKHIAFDQESRVHERDQAFVNPISCGNSVIQALWPGAGSRPPRQHHSIRRITSAVFLSQTLDPSQADYVAIHEREASACEATAPGNTDSGTVAVP